jgi:hypothetical protein
LERGVQRHPRQSMNSPMRQRNRNAVGPVVAAGFFALATAAYAVDRAKFEPLHRAAEAMSAATASDASYERISELARAFAEALVASKDTVRSDEDRALLLLYAQAGLAYGDGLAFLREKAANRNGFVPASAPAIAPLVTRYAIATPEDDVDTDSALRVIWATADEALRKAELLYEGRQEELAAIMGADHGGTPAPAARNEDEERQREMIQRIAAEFDHPEPQAPKRPQPYEVTTGNWTCPRGYVVRHGECLSDQEIAHLPKVEVSQ